jgi:protease YdgD
MKTRVSASRGCKIALLLLQICIGWQAAAATLPLLPGVAASDRRKPVDLQDGPWRWLVRVQTELGGRCTGVVVAPRVVETAAHCLFLSRTGNFIQPTSVHVLLGYRQGQYVAHARVARFVIPDGYDPRQEDRTAALDRATLILSTPLPVPGGGAPVAPPPPDGATVRLGGYGQDRDELAVADPDCRVVGRSADGGGRPLLAHDCEATRGTSGAPLLWQAPDGHWAAVGLQIEAAGDGAGGRAVPLETPGSAAASPAAGRTAGR